MYIKVKVKASSKIENLKPMSKDHFEVLVKEPAERNLANKRVLAIFEKHFKVKGVRLISGHHSMSKILSIPE